MEYSAEQMAEIMLLYHATKVATLKTSTSHKPRGRPSNQELKARSDVQEGLLKAYRSKVPVDVQRLLDIGGAELC